jgi:hypothetical protein
MSYDGLLTFGRQGLFAHDNTRQALAMDRAAVSLSKGVSGAFDRDYWAEYRKKLFEAHLEN